MSHDFPSAAIFIEKESLSRVKEKEEQTSQHRPSLNSLPRKRVVCCSRLSDRDWANFITVIRLSIVLESTSYCPVLEVGPFASVSCEERGQRCFVSTGKKDEVRSLSGFQLTCEAFQDVLQDKSMISRIVSSGKTRPQVVQGRRRVVLRNHHLTDKS